jgi:hemerythrin superfamily protein
VDLAAYDEFRRGLLRHIAMEEKVLLPAAREWRGGDPLPTAGQLKRDHAALAVLLVPSPTPTIMETIRSILVDHNLLEEGPEAVYESCEKLAGERVEALAEQLRAVPEARVAPHYDTPLVREHIRLLLDARRRSD